MSDGRCLLCGSDGPRCPSDCPLGEADDVPFPVVNHLAENGGAARKVRQGERFPPGKTFYHTKRGNIDLKDYEYIYDPFDGEVWVLEAYGAGMSDADRIRELEVEVERLRADLTHSEANRNANLSAANVALARAEKGEADRARLRSAVQKHLKDGYNAQGGWDGLIEALADTDPEESQ